MRASSPRRAISRKAAAQPARGLRTARMISVSARALISTSPCKPVCSRSNLGMRMPRELPTRTIRVFMKRFFSCLQCSYLVRRPEGEFLAPLAGAQPAEKRPRAGGVRLEVGEEAVAGNAVGRFVAESAGELAEFRRRIGQGIGRAIGDHAQSALDEPQEIVRGLQRRMVVASQ